MRAHLKAHIPAILLIALFSLLLLWGTRLVPFHPDETSWLFQSSDFERLFTDPLSLAWQPDRPLDLEMTYRALNGPLAKYVIGAARRLAGYGAEAVSVDWDWSRTWEENRAAGALPAPAELEAGRVGSTILVILSLGFIYLCGLRLGGRITGLLAMAGLGTNALLLLHGRRAMAEGALTFGVTFALFTILQAERRPWLAGLGTALAFCAKFSTGVLLPVGAIAVVWSGNGRRGGVSRGLLQYLLAFTVLTLALNPILWAHPVSSVQLMWQARNELVARQSATIEGLNPGATLDAPLARVVYLTAGVFVSPPQFAEAPNYRAQTATAEAVYMAVPGNNLMRGFAGGGLMLGLTLAGMVLAGLETFRRVAEPRRTRGLLLTATLLQAAALAWAIPLPFQRYVVPLVPYVSLWSAYAVNLGIRVFAQRGRPPVGTAS